MAFRYNDSIDPWNFLPFNLLLYELMLLLRTKFMYNGNANLVAETMNLISSLQPVVGKAAHVTVFIVK